MRVPVISKIKEQPEIFIERTLPVEGDILVEKGKKLEPFDHLGICSYSQKTLKLPARFRPRKFKKDGQYFYANSFLGKNGRESVAAPFNGNLYRLADKTYEFREESSKYMLLSGVWGEVDKITDSRSVLIKAKTKDINLSVATNTNFAGELVVFPNPSHLLEKFYLEGFASGSSEGKIVYVGNYVTMGLLTEAVKYGVGAIIGGSADIETFRFALRSNISFGLFSGFGESDTPQDIYEVLNSVYNRYVFFQGERNLLRIPLPPDSGISTIKPGHVGAITEVSKGDKVLVLQRPYFGKTGEVDRVGESSIFVKFSLNENPVEIRVPNFFLISYL